MTRDDEHRHHRTGDGAFGLKVMDAVYKGAKIGAALLGVFIFLSTIRERLQAIPVIQDDVRTLKAESSATKEQIAYLVGGMESMTGRRFKPSRRQ